MQQNKAGEQKSYKQFGRFKESLFTILIFFSTVTLDAQQSFKEFQNSQNSSFATYVDDKDKAFNAHLKQQWEAFESYKTKPLYSKPKPVTITPLPPTTPKAVGPQILIKTPPKIEEPKQPEAQKPAVVPQNKATTEPKIIDKPVVVAVKAPQKDINFDFFGASLSFTVDKNIKKASFYPRDQTGVSNFFDTLSATKTQAILQEIKEAKKSLNLNDWGLYLLVGKISTQLFKNQDDATLFNWYIFNKLGYGVRVAIGDGRVVEMFYSTKLIYSTPSYNFANKQYFVLSDYNKESPKRVFSYKQEYPEAIKAFDFSMSSLPTFPMDKQTKELQSKQDNKTVKLTINYNKNLIDFMATYPQVEYETFFNTPLEPQTTANLITALKRELDGKRASDAINFILHFVQNAFAYETDDKQFGREKVMFAQETLFYDKSDCEDRAILFSYLVKEILEISAVGLKYDDHMATALFVPIDGDKIHINSKEFVVADPTYINSNVGMSMPKYKNIKPQSYIVVKAK